MNIAYTLFEIVNASRLSFRYRLIRVREQLPDDARQPIRLQKWADELWRRRLKCPVFPMRRGGQAYFIVPAETELGGVDLSYVDVPYITYHADPTDEYRKINLAQAEPREFDLLSKILERPFSDALSARTQEFWRDSWTRFFRMEPENSAIPTDAFNAFRGVAFAVVSMPPNRIFLALDVVTRYVARLSLAGYRAKGREEDLANHCVVAFEKRRWFVRDNGPVKYRCLYAGDTGRTISEFYIEDLHKTVLEYYREKFLDIGRTLDPNEPAVYCARDKKDEDPVPAPASRLFPVFPFEKGFRERCSVAPQLAPEERKQTLLDFVRNLAPVRYGGQVLEISDRLLTTRNQYFAVPRLEFAGGVVLSPDELRTPKDDYPIATWGAAKTRTLIQVGPYFREDIPPIILLYPLGLDRRTREAFVRAVEQEVSICAASDGVLFTKQLAYVPDPNGHDFLLKTSELKRQHGAHTLLVCILSRSFEDYVHNRFKSECEDLYSQCVKEENVRDVTFRRANRRNFALGVMMALGFKPWVLATPLNVDLHIGIDVLDEHVAYTFLFGLGGREIFRDHGYSGGDELIKTRLLREKLIAGFIRIRDAGVQINSFVVHRDGRWWPKETEALDEAVGLLVTEDRKVLLRDVRYAVAEIRKSHFPIRIFSTEYRNSRPVFRNPFPGCYLVLDSNRAVLTSTGRPSEWDEQGRTAGTVLIQLAHNPGALRVEDIARDVFFLTQLNWSAPDIEINAPVTIRWADDMLRDLYIEPDR